jgi:hypothetical protein
MVEKISPFFPLSDRRKTVNLKNNYAVNPTMGPYIDCRAIYIPPPSTNASKKVKIFLAGFGWRNKTLKITPTCHFPREVNPEGLEKTGFLILQRRPFASGVIQSPWSLH